MKLHIFNIKHLIQKAQNGDELSREQLLNKHRNFIVKVSAVVCGRFLTWENDEELSIALIAFNEAIDAYDTGENIKFTNFAQTVIKRRLIDYFRRQKKYTNEFLSSPSEGNDELETSLNTKSLLEHVENISQENLAYLIEQYKLQLDEYDIDIHELPKVSPKHKDTRESLMKTAQALVNDQEMLSFLRRNGQLPIKKLCEATGLSNKVLERGRKYIISVAIILTEPILSPLRHFTNFPLDKGGVGYEE